MQKESVVRIHNAILLGRKGERNNAICSNMDGPTNYHTERRKSDRDIAYTWNKKKMVQMNLFTKQKQSQIQKTNLWL